MGLTVFFGLFFGVFCLLVLGIVLWLAVRFVDAATRRSPPAAGDVGTDTGSGLKPVWVKAAAGAGILLLFVFGIWKVAFEPPSASDSFQEVFHQAPPPSVHNLNAPTFDSWGDSTIIGLTFPNPQARVIKIAGKEHQAMLAKDYNSNLFADQIKVQPGKPTSFYTSTKFCDSELATCDCTIGYDDAHQTAYVYSSAND